MSAEYYNLRNADLREFEEFVFSHPYHNVGSDKCWYHQFELEIDYDPTRNAELFIELFENSKGLLEKYDPKLLAQGCWAMFGAGFDGNLVHLIWESDFSKDQKIGTDLKVRLIQSMFHIFDDFFSVADCDGAGFMWWDELAYDFGSPEFADPERNEDHYRIREAMFETLCKILALENKDCQFAALHGMNHVAHPKSGEVVSEFVRQHPELSEQEREYAMACSRSEVM